MVHGSWPDDIYGSLECEGLVVFEQLLKDLGVFVKDDLKHVTDDDLKATWQTMEAFCQWEPRHGVESTSN